MALITCHECGAEISDTATACPRCGAKPKPKTKLITWIIGGIFAFSIGSAIKQQSIDAERPPPTKTAAQVVAEAQQDANFQRVTAMLRAMKAATKNPDSFKVVEAGMTADGTICVVYRGTNSFNAIVTEQVAISKVNKTGDWDRLCDGKSRTDFTHARRAI